LAIDGGGASAEAPPAWGTVGDYERLPGGEGRAVHFRPQRHRGTSWAPVAVVVHLCAGAETTSTEVVDVSQSGVAFVWPAHRPVSIGQELNDIVVSFDGREAYRGAARVASARRDEGGRTLAGLALIDGAIDVDSWLQVRDVRLRLRPRWRPDGQERFKAGVASLRLLLEDVEEMLAGLDASLSPPAGGADRAPLVDAAIEEEVRREIVPEVVALSGEIDQAFRTATSPTERAALGAFSQRCLQDVLMCAPWMHRARHKPLGYPGDFGVMAFVYNAPFSGPTLFARALSVAFSCTPAGEAVRARKDMLRAQLSARLDRPLGHWSRPLRILSIASGPAQEIVELLDSRPPPPYPVEIVLFDQEQRALAHASAAIRRAARWPGCLQVRYLHDAIKPLLRGAGALAGEGTFDVIYACGLLDYLQPRTAVSLCRNLYERLAPGGTLYAGNMVPSNPSRWFMELHLDWFLIYREIEELLHIGRTAAPGADVQLLEESTGVNPFVALRRDG
jgi:SAM-dependent methyltransferase